MNMDSASQLQAATAGTNDDRSAAALRGFGPAGIGAIVFILLGSLLSPFVGAILAILWAWASRTPWKDLGFIRPKNCILTVVIGVIFGCAFKFLMKAFVMPLLGADPINHAYHYLAGNSAAIPGMLFSVIVGAGFGEEVMFRSYFFERFGKLFGKSVFAKIAIVLLTSVWFGILHYPTQGIAGMEQALIVGLVYASIFTFTNQIWMLMIAHAAFDVTAVAIIYWNLETSIAHFIFR